MSEDIDDKTENEFYLKCKILIRTIQSKDQKPNGEIFWTPRTMAFLIPELNDQGVRFLDAWLPEGKDEHFEMYSALGSPISSSCRLAICRKNQDIEDHHLVVMSKGVEEEMVEYGLSGKVITAKILPSSADSENKIHDESKDSNKSYETY